MRTPMLLLLVLFMALSSCDYNHEKEYNVENMTGTQIEVLFDIPQGSDSTVVDSLSVDQIYYYDYVFGSVGVSDDRYEDDISNIKIRAFDTVVAIHESRWIYNKLDKYYAKYTLKIDSTDFK